MHLLVLSFHYPPSIAAGGSRVESFVRYALCQRDFEQAEIKVTVCCSGPQSENSMGMRPELSEDLKKVNQPDVFRIPFRHPGQQGGSIQKLESTRLEYSRRSPWIARLKTGLRPLVKPILDLYEYPDIYHPWATESLCKLSKSLSSAGDRFVIFSSGPPHSAHLAARRLKRKLRCPWVMDLRDPWIGNPFRKGLSYPAEHFDRAIEMSCFIEANAIVANTHPVLNMIEDRFGSTVRDKSFCVPNGYEENDFLDLEARPLWEVDSRPVVLYAGSLYGPRSGSTILRAMRLLKDGGRNLPRLVLLGGSDQKAENELVNEMSGKELVDFVEIIPSVSKVKALCAMKAADALLLIGDNRPKQMQVPSKLFEYLRIGKPILALYPQQSPVTDYLRQYAGRYWQSNPEDIGGVMSAISAFVEEFSIGIGPFVPLRPLSDLSRQVQNKILLDIIKGVV